MRRLPLLLLVLCFGLLTGGCTLLGDDDGGGDAAAGAALTDDTPPPAPGTLADLLAFEAEVLRRRAAWSEARLDAWSVAAAAGWTDEAEERFRTTVGSSADALADWLRSEVLARRELDVADDVALYRDALLDWAAAVGIWSTRVAGGAVPDQPPDLAVARARDTVLERILAEDPVHAYLRATSARLVDIATYATTSLTGFAQPTPPPGAQRRAWEDWTLARVEEAEANLRAWDGLLPAFDWADLHRRWHDALTAEVDLARDRLRQVREGPAYWEGLSPVEAWAAAAEAPNLFTSRDRLRAEWLDRVRHELADAAA